MEPLEPFNVIYQTAEAGLGDTVKPRLIEAGADLDRVLIHEKSSLASPGASLAFSLGEEDGFHWVGEYDITADEMLSGTEPKRESKIHQVKDLICKLLAGGKRMLSEEIDRAALEKGIPSRTVREAKKELGESLKSRIVEGRRKEFWME